MKHKNILLTIGFASIVVLGTGCSDSEQNQPQQPAAPAAVQTAEAASAPAPDNSAAEKKVVGDPDVNNAYVIEFRSALESLSPVGKGNVSAADLKLPENKYIADIIAKLRRMYQMTSIEIFAISLTKINDKTFTAHHRDKLMGEGNPGVIPFFVEDSDGTFYFAPPEEQEYIISKWKYWFEQKGQNFDYDGCIKSSK